MNFLAHLYLSGDHPDIRLGNFIGDFVKGRQYERYPLMVRKGILLHRQIDAYTDVHPMVKNSKTHFQDHYKRYAGVVVDLIYDHYLASNWNSYSMQPLPQFVSQVHALLMKNYFRLPGEVKQFLPFLIQSRRLENYKHFDGIERSLTIMTRNSSLPDHVHYAMNQLHRHYGELEHEFTLFFNDVKQMVNQELSTDLIDN